MKIVYDLKTKHLTELSPGTAFRFASNVDNRLYLTTDLSENTGHSGLRTLCRKDYYVYCVCLEDGHVLQLISGCQEVIPVDITIHVGDINPASRLIPPKGSNAPDA